jgi:hypothetical protein
MIEPEPENYCKHCEVQFDNAFDYIDHMLEDDEQFDPYLVLPNGIKLMIGSLLRFIFEHADKVDEIRQISQSTYVTLFAAETDEFSLQEMIEDVIVDNEMLFFDDALRKLLEEDRPNDNKDGA